MAEPEKPANEDPTRGIAKPLNEQKSGDKLTEQEEPTLKDIPAKE